MEQLPIIVYSHLPWSVACQRPQQLFSRIAAEWPVYFFEETVAAEPLVPDSIELRYPQDNLVVIKPILQEFSGPFDLARLGALKKRFLRWQQIERHIAWVYTPLAYPLARALEPELVVYDCMEELAAAADADPALRAHESRLLAEADLVFTGAPSSYRAKREHSPYVRCFPSSVDVEHFAPGADALQEPPDQRVLARPRLGYFGPIDARIDRELLDALAAARPEWQIVLIGPFVDVEPGSLPRRPNLHYLGERPYAALPSYVAGWDACLLPFARNRSTRFVSPARVLPYLAAEKPVVSTSVRDVVEPYGRALELADEPAAFVAACERVLSEGDAERSRRVSAMRKLARRSSWDDTAQSMLAELRAAAQSRQLARTTRELPRLSAWASPAAS